VTPGGIDVLPEGYGFEAFDPTHPSGNFGPFVKATLRGIASGLGVSYNSLASDLEGVNLSSIRAGLIEEREHWRAIQRELGEQFLDKVFPSWLDMAFLVGALDPLPARKYEKFCAPVWHFRGWMLLDPESDTNAAILAINAGLKTRTAVLAEQGKDLGDVLEQLKSEQDLIKQYGVEITLPASFTQAQAAKPKQAAGAANE
jgi:lambda family phage portal protein